MSNNFGVEEVDSDEDILLPDPEQPGEQPIPVIRRVERLQLQVLYHVSESGRLQVATGYTVDNDGYLEGRRNCLMLAVNGPNCDSEGPIFKKSPKEIREAMATWFNSLNGERLQILSAAFDVEERPAITNQLVKNGTIPSDFFFQWLEDCWQQFLSKPVAIVLTMKENSSTCTVNTTGCFSCRGAEEVIFLQLDGPHYVRWMPYGGNFRHILDTWGIRPVLSAVHKLESDILDNNVYVTRRMCAYMDQLEKEKSEMESAMHILNDNQRMLEERPPVRTSSKKRVRQDVSHDLAHHRQDMLFRIRSKDFVPSNMEEISRFIEQKGLDSQVNWREWCRLYKLTIDLPGGYRFIFAEKDDTSVLREVPANDAGQMPPP